MAQDININIGADAQGAVNGFNQTANAADNAAEQVQDLSTNLEKQEARIKTLDGAINLLGGSVEVLAGGLALTGALSKEQAGEFQTAAVGAIAFADGTKRILDGYKSLTEGLKAYGGISGVATKATKALNMAIRANPAVAIAVGVAALTTAIIAYINATDDAEEAEKRRIETEQQGITQRKTAISREERLAQARGESIEVLAELRKETMELRLEEIKLERQRLQGPGGKNVLENQKEINALGEEYLTLKTEIEAFEIETANAIAERNKRQKEQQDTADKAAQQAAIAARNARLEAEGLKQTIQNLTDETIEWLGLFKFDQDDGPLEVIEEIDEAFADLGDTIFFTKQQLDEFERAEAVLIDQSFDARRKRLEEYYNDLIEQAASNASEVEQLERAKNKALGDLDKQRADEQKENIRKAAEATLATTISLLSTIRETTDDGTKEGFEKSKKFRIAETRLSSIQAAYDAFRSLVGVPYVGYALGTAAAAAALFAGQTAINDIKSSTYNDTSAPGSPVGGSGGGTPNVGGGAVQVTSGFANRAPVTTGQPQDIRAYVVTGDVSNGLQAQAQLRTRRRFG